MNSDAMVADVSGQNPNVLYELGMRHAVNPKPTVAVLLLTAEDESADGTHRARQNVVHEAGLFQGHLGFQRVVMLVQDGLEEFSNVAGVQYISFRGEQVEQTFWELQRALRREGLITAAQPSAAADAPQASRR
jgi:predicted nucleotide-binding protein